MDPTSPPSMEEDLTCLETALEGVRLWMFNNKLCLNESKTKFIIFGKKSALLKIPSTSIHVRNAEVSCSTAVRNLGINLDSELKFTAHITKVTASCRYQIHRAWQIRKLLFHDAAVRLMVATVLSRLDYCNSILINLPKKEVQRLQKIQNAATPFVTQLNKHDSISEVLKQLHWLPVEYRIKYKVLCIIHKWIYGKAPKYLKELLMDYVPVRNLRSSSHRLLCVPTVNMVTYGGRAFSVAGPKLWN